MLTCSEGFPCLPLVTSPPPFSWLPCSPSQMPLLESIDKQQLVETEIACSAPLSLQSGPLHHGFFPQSRERTGKNVTSICSPGTIKLLPTNAFLPYLSISLRGTRPGNRGSHFLSKVLYLSSGRDETSLLRDEIGF